MYDHISEWTLGLLSNVMCRPITLQFTGCHQPVQRSYWPESVIYWLAKWNEMRNAWTRKLQLSGPTVPLL